MKPRRNILLSLFWYHPKIHLGVRRYAMEHGWHLDAGQNYHREKLSTHWRGDGVLTQQPETPAQLEFLQGLQQPKVFIGYIDASVFSDPSITHDDEAIAGMALAHFRGLGFRHYANFVEGLPDFPPRNQAFTRQVATVTGTTCHKLLVPLQHTTYAARKRWMTRQLKKLPLPCAVFCADDDQACVLMEYAADAGLRVPEDLAVLGVRDDELLCESQPVSLSSIDNNLERVGYEAARCLDAVLDGHPPAERVWRIPPLRVVARRSTEVLAVNHPSIQKALAHLRENYDQPLQMKMLAQVAGLSLRGLFLAFRNEMDSTPGEALLRIRMEHARHMLLESNATIDVVAEACGFGDRRNLHLAFRKTLNTTPTAYRREPR